MNLVQIKQDEINGICTAIPEYVQVFPVADFEAAQSKLLELVQTEFAKLDVTIEPKAYKRQVCLSLDDNTKVEDEFDDHYFVSIPKKPSNTVPVAEIAVNESAVEINWFLVD
jgi:hypothetical protein